MKKPMNAAAIAAAHLRETENPSVGWGDTGLLHEIADKLSMPHEGVATEAKVLNRIDRSHDGFLVKRYESYAERGLSKLRRFWLPEKLRRSDQS